MKRDKDMTAACVRVQGIEMEILIRMAYKRLAQMGRRNERSRGKRGGECQQNILWTIYYNGFCK